MTARVRTRAVTVRTLIVRAARRLARARVYFGHGSDNASDEAATLVLHAVRLARGAGAALYGRRVGLAAQRRARELVTRRIKERIPAAYLTGVTWFAGVRLQVDARVLVPRSPIAELIERRFAPWIDARRVRRVLDVGTGSGCIAIACAKALPWARVDAVDIADAALDVARVNVRRHRLTQRVRLRKSDHFRALGRATYDIIVSNPPYVGARELARLPPEYRHEPRVALAAGSAGLDSVRIILGEARRHLRPRGVLIVEVGNTESAVRRAFRRLPFVWLEFERGGGGVFLLSREQLSAR
ncbi:MAG TPA: 50S ribosomal protein L3 N(5)-glutamine methyltransferase [Steroidobacteraceae bacterium]